MNKNYVNKKKAKKLDTTVMQNKLKGDLFPDSWDNYLDESVRDFFTELFHQTGLRKSSIIMKANLSRSTGYQIMDGTRPGKRDFFLAIALAMSLDLSTTQRMLAVTKKGSLHPLVKRDAAVIFAINHQYDLEQTYDFMCEVGVDPLDTGLEDEV